MIPRSAVHSPSWQNFFTSLLASSILAFMLTGCQMQGETKASSLTQDVLANYAVSVSEAENTADLPLDHFVLKDEAATSVEYANTILLSKCMIESGKPVSPRLFLDWRGRPNYPDPYFGLFSPQLAETVGYDLPRAQNASEIASQEKLLSRSWWNDWDRCLDSVAQVPLSAINSTMPPTVADRGRVQSLDRAAMDPEWIDVRGKWVDCLGKVGLEPDDEVSLDPSEVIKHPSMMARASEGRDTPLEKIAKLDAECKQKLNTAFSLAKILAKHELEYVGQNRKELEALAIRNQNALAAATKIIAECGSMCKAKP